MCCTKEHGCKEGLGSKWFKRKKAATNVAAFKIVNITG